MRYYIADNHFFHGNLIRRMDMRDFSSTEEMNEHMIKQWNSKVRRNDEVVILGDFSFGRPDETNEVLKRLNGRLFLIKGNHDKRWLHNNEYALKRFRWIKDYAEVNDNKRRIVLSHYPIMSYAGQFRKDENGNPITWMLHGHIHQTDDISSVELYKEFVRTYLRKSRQNEEPEAAPIQMINCFCMFSDYKPLTLDEWIELENKGITRKSRL